MITIEETFTGPRDFPVSGNHFQLLASSNGPVDVLFFGAGMPNGSAFAVAPGYKSNDPFGRLRIIAAGAPGSTIKFLVADRDPNITDPVDRALRRLGVVDGGAPIDGPLSWNGLPAASLSARKALLVQDGGVLGGTEFVSNALIAAGGTLQVVGPGASGFVIFDSHLITSSAAVQTIALLASNGVPGSVVAGIPVDVAAVLAGGLSQPRRLALRRMLNAIPTLTLGLWYFSVALEVAPSYKHLSYNSLIP